MLRIVAFTSKELNFTVFYLISRGDVRCGHGGVWLVEGQVEPQHAVADEALSLSLNSLSVPGPRDHWNRRRGAGRQGAGGRADWPVLQVFHPVCDQGGRRRGQEAVGGVLVREGGVLNDHLLLPRRGISVLEDGAGPRGRRRRKIGVADRVGAVGAAGDGDAPVVQDGLVFGQGLGQGQVGGHGQGGHVGGVFPVQMTGENLVALRT